ncbi:MAG TPA: outer membrane protein assembly factor BamA [Candidatus Eisenbacteria bacterium]|nr:outer membrane protein assembly factor BamA [Candidatus Eisenbacteria bacterium]
MAASAGAQGPDAPALSPSDSTGAQGAVEQAVTPSAAPDTAAAPGTFQDAPAPTPAPAPSRDTTRVAPSFVGHISVQGNVATDTARIIRSFEVIPGSRFSLEAVQRGIHKLFALGLFADAWVERLPRGNEVDLVIHVVERARIGAIEFTGNKRRETDELEKKLFLRVGEPYTPTLVQTQVDTLLKYYREEGFGRATIDAKVDSTAGNRVKVTFAVREGERVRVTKVEFVGMKAFDPAKLKKTIATKTKGFFGGGEIKDESFAEDLEKLREYYWNHGYRDVRLVSHELKPGKGPRDLTLVFTIEEGRRYVFGTGMWTGNQVLRPATLARFWTAQPGDVYDRSKVQKAVQDAYAAYAEEGYLYLGIEPRENVRDSAVDVAFLVQEGSPSNVRYIHITGNHGTREKVVRREIDIHEGDRFKRSSLVRSQGDVFRLGFFEDVQIDFVPAESTDVDITLKVKEKQVGTASAGAGYTAQSGVTGFLELGHNNVLGNGQNLSLHLERGAKRSDYFISFTEPWFRDTPTLLGFSAFRTNRELDLYEEKRDGGSVRIGRPLAWPDYARGSLTYQLENVTIHIDKVNLSPQDSIVLRGLENGKATLSSSMSAFFVRNSRNNPFYPTGGTQLSIETEAAGGPFGGAINFHKERLEGRAYFRSIIPTWTTMVRARVGFVGKYADQNFPVPQYERFRLGGGTTIDPLRGYEDYMVVPEKFIRDVDNITTRVINDSTVFDTVTTVSRYPGGQFMTSYSIEQQFAIAHPLHAVLFFDAGNTWDLMREARPFDLKMGAGVGIRLEIPLLGNIGFDFGYGFNRGDLRDRPKWVGHFLLGQTSF